MMSDEEHAILAEACAMLRKISSNAPFLLIFAFDRGDDNVNVCVGSNLNPPDHVNIMHAALEGYRPAASDETTH